jgi:poly(beta-D-mannuronate) lyase
LAAGSDDERSAVPIGTTMKNNILLSTTNLKPFTIYDDVSGIEFAGNIMNEEAEAPFTKGFEKVPFSISQNEYGLWVPDQQLIDRINFGEVKLPVTKEEVGANYYPKGNSSKNFGSGNIIDVQPGTDTILEALNLSAAGDILKLTNGEEYLMTKYAFVNHPVSIITTEGEKAIIISEKQSFFKIENGGALELKNVVIDGRASPDLAGNNVVSTSKYSMTKNYALVLENVEVLNLDKNHSFDFLKAYKHTFADSIVLRNTTMTNITGSVMNLDLELEDLGIYNVENVKIIDSEFNEVQGAIANIYRGGTDESTFGPIVAIQNVNVVNSGKGSRNRSEASFRFHGVQRLNISNSTISNSAPIDLFMTNGEPITEFENITLRNTPRVKSNHSGYKALNIKVVN